MGKVNTQEMYDEWNDLQAYRELEGSAFDFGTGLITDDSAITETIFWKMDQWKIESKLCNKYKKHSFTKERLNRYDRKLITKAKMKKLLHIAWMSVYYDEDLKRYFRYYRGSRSKFLKHVSNKKTRKYDDNFSHVGSGYKKIFDFWHTLW